MPPSSNSIAWLFTLNRYHSRTSARVFSFPYPFSTLTDQRIWSKCERITRKPSFIRYSSREIYSLTPEIAVIVLIRFRFGNILIDKMKVPMFAPKSNGMSTARCFSIILVRKQVQMAKYFSYFRRHINIEKAWRSKLSVRYSSRQFHPPIIASIQWPFKYTYYYVQAYYHVADNEWVGFVRFIHSWLQ